MTDRATNQPTDRQNQPTDQPTIRPTNATDREVTLPITITFYINQRISKYACYIHPQYGRLDILQYNKCSVSVYTQISRRRWFGGSLARDQSKKCFLKYEFNHLTMVSYGLVLAFIAGFRIRNFFADPDPDPGGIRGRGLGVKGKTIFF